jgi:3-hydroxybutyryl-CoA dehydrogenase
MERIAVIGGGLMGTGIAQVFAIAGHDVIIFEPNTDARASIVERVARGLEAIGLDTAASKCVTVADSLPDAVAGADYVTEAAPEKLDLKRRIFVQLVEHAPANAILASNSSVIPVTSISEGLATAGRMVGTHWWNPAPLIPLVEVIQGACTTDATIAATMDLLRRAGKSPAHVRKDVPGFVANRMQHALWREAIAMVAEGICDAETVDACVKNSFGLRLPVLGPLENADLVGLDLTLDIHRTIIPELDRHAGPNEYLEAKVAAGDLGFKTGRGMRSWSPEEMEALRGKLTDYLVATRSGR